MKRVITASIFLAVILASIIIGSWALALFLLTIMFFGMKELTNMMYAKALHPNKQIAYISCVLYTLIGLFNRWDLFVIVTVFCSIYAFIAILKRGPKARVIDIGATLLCFIYGGVLPVHFLFLRNMDAGQLLFYNFNFDNSIAYVFLMVIGITMTDVFAYYIGKNFGKTKLWPEVSPKKTIEGAAGGALFAILACLVIGYFINLSFWQSFFAGVIITASAQFGDLFESMIKRDAGTKDSSDILPGHGGFLDRADSYIFTVAATYYYFYYFVAYPIFLVR
ncbi:MAG: phosphatidate cytidylyltransferase [Candidatus Gastranaerophilales bacterium]|nr:phosphatidate cytidylyltransferase [Candidatus Gastranaerophilales bacterium]